MEAPHRYIRTIERGDQQVTIELPEGVDKAEIEVIVRPLYSTNEERTKASRLEVIQRFKGIFKDSTYQADKYDVYEQ